MSPQAAGTTCFVARQPVFDCAKNVIGYELLCRCAQEDGADAADARISALDVIAGGSLGIGLDELTGGKRAFVSLAPKPLPQAIAAPLPGDRVTICIPEDASPDEETLAACRAMKAAGYMLALHDSATSASDSPFLDLADIVKVNFLATAPQRRKRIVQDLAARGIKALAEKVESPEAFDEAAECGYSYFHGNFFARPTFHPTGEIAGNKLSRLKMLDELYRTEFSYERLEEVIKQDVSLTYDLLRFINSAWFGLRYKVTSIKHALVLLGPKEIRKWFALVTLRSMGTDRPNELLLRCMTRAKMGELAAPLIGLDARAPELFLMGMFSIIDALLNAPMRTIMARLPLADPIKAALLGHPNQYRTIFEAIVSYEKGEWDDFLRHAAQLRLDGRRMLGVYVNSLKWASLAFAHM
jgi:EAL and modified HD-GYP domain-containing signal transduction protein